MLFPWIQEYTHSIGYEKGLFYTGQFKWSSWHHCQVQINQFEQFTNRFRNGSTQFVMTKFPFQRCQWVSIEWYPGIKTYNWAKSCSWPIDSGREPFKWLWERFLKIQWEGIYQKTLRYTFDIIGVIDRWMKEWIQSNGYWTNS